MSLTFVKVNHENLDIFERLAQSYEAEFSKLTKKLPNEFGIFELDTYPNPPYVGYLAYMRATPIGFCVADVESEVRDVAEFYILPVMRKKGFGYQLAEMIFDEYPGEWQVRQIEGAVIASNFWRKVISKYTGSSFKEALVKDDHWGVVTRQSFHSRLEESLTNFRRCSC